MKIWFDADNAPHVLIIRPLVEELRRRGHEILITARDRASTCQILDLYELEYLKIGTEFGAKKIAKALGTIRRAFDLVRAARSWRPDISFGHGSRSLPIASWLLGIPSVTMYDYEWVDPRIFNWFCRTILLPEVIDEQRCREAGIRLDKVRRYPGYKEELYLQGKEPQEEVAGPLGLDRDRIQVLLRPPAFQAHYHNPESEKLLDALLDRILARPDIQLVYLPRAGDPTDFSSRPHRAEVIMTDRVFDGPSLVAAMDTVISGGGTMTREAAVLGVPSVSFFQGREGRVDEALARAGRLILLRSPEEVRERVNPRKRRSLDPGEGKPSLAVFIADEIEASAGLERGRPAPQVPAGLCRS